jgi:leucyl-tRNA synthetase
MDTFMDSSWYFFRFLDPMNDTKIFDKKISSHLPVDLYIGGVEHAILHLLYLRFISKFLHSQGAWTGGDGSGEAVKRLVTQGMVHGKTLSDPDTGRFLKPDEVDTSEPSQPRVKATGKPASVSFEKMSKSKHNGVNPTECIAKYGADAVRAHILFQAPIEDVLLWDEEKIVGIQRWLGRVANLVDSISTRIRNGEWNGKSTVDLESMSHEGQQVWSTIQLYIRQITTALHEDLTLNTVVSDYMKLTRTIADAEKSSDLPTEALVRSTEDLLKAISPVVPVNAEENWSVLLEAQGRPWTSIFAEDWPQAKIVSSSSTTVQVMVNGRRRAAVVVPTADAEVESTLLEAARASEAGKFFNGKTIKKVVIPKGKKTFSILVA